MAVKKSQTPDFDNLQSKSKERAEAQSMMEEKQNDIERVNVTSSEKRTRSLINFENEQIKARIYQP